MSAAAPPHDLTVADLLKRLGDVPASRVRMVPAPGTATEKDVVAIHDREGRLFELVDGVLVEKGMGYDESKIAMLLAVYLGNFILQHDLGDILGADGIMRLFPGAVRIPDVAFISWDRVPQSGRKRGEIPDIAPDLVVEVLSKSNRRREMERKLDEYFRAGVRLVWYVDPKRRTVRVYSARNEFATLTADDELDGGEVLPGFRLSIADWFHRAERTSPEA
jgi:Uma2 family endonuclease